MALAPLPIVIPLFVAALLAGTGRLLHRRVKDTIAIATTVVVAALCVALIAESRAGSIVYWMGGWRPRGGIAVGIALVVDPAGAGLGALSAVLSCAAFVFTLQGFDDVHALFHALMLGFLAALVAFGLTGDLFDLFVFFELMSAAAFALCAYKSDEVGPLQGALNFAVTNSVGAYLTLFGLALAYGRTGALNYAQIARALGSSHDALVVASFFLIASGFLVKAAAFPFHFWLADAHAVAPTPVSVLFSGVMVTAGVYGVARVWWSVFAGALAPGAEGVRHVLLAVGAATVLVGGSMCWAQRNLKRLLAFSTIAHIGIMVLGVALLSTTALAGVITYALGHGLVKGALFLLAGALLHSCRTVDEIALRGRGPRWLGIAWASAGLGLAGLPPFGTHVGDETIADAAEHAGHGWLVPMMAFAQIVTAAAVLRVAGRVFLGWGTPKPEFHGGGEHSEEPETLATGSVPWSMAGSAVVVLGLALAVGMVPSLRQGALAAAGRMTDTKMTTAQVLGMMPVPPPEALPATAPVGVARGLGCASAAVLLALLTLFRERLPEGARRPVRRALDAAYRGMCALHTGHVADYVTWLVVGVAALGLAGEVLVRGR